MSTVPARVVRVAKRRFELRADQVERAMLDVRPEPISSHYVVIDNRRFPPKQVIGAMTGVDRADFTSHQARRILMGLGFAAGRQPREEETERRYETRAAHGGDASEPSARPLPSRPSAETLAPYVGEWVATRGPRVLTFATDPRAVVSWLAEHRQEADSMFRVPADELRAGGLAPL